MGRNGGKTVRVLKAGQPGQPSTVLVDLELDFDRKGYENLPVAKDFAFVLNGGKTLLVMPSGTAHEVAIVDFDNDFATTYVTLSDKEFINEAPHGRYRRVEWAVGTEYVWTNDSQLDEHYVINVKEGKVVKTITGIDSADLLSVQNWERVRETTQQEKLLETIEANQAQAIAVAIEEQQQPLFRGNLGNSDDGESAVVVAAMVVATLALVVGVINLVYMVQFQKTKEPAKTIEHPFDSKVKLPVDKVNDPRHDPMAVST